MTTPYTLTGATDWPMLVATLKLVAWIIGGLISLVCLLIGLLWTDMRKQFSSHATGEESRCRETRTLCRKNVLRELNAMWSVLDIFFPREAKKAREGTLIENSLEDIS